MTTQSRLEFAEGDREVAELAQSVAHAEEIEAGIRERNGFGCSFDQGYTLWQPGAGHHAGAGLLYRLIRAGLVTSVEFSENTALFAAK